MTLTMTAAVPHLSMKRPAPQDYLDSTDSAVVGDEDSIHSSPINLLNTLTAAAANAKKLRKDESEICTTDNIQDVESKVTEEVLDKETLGSDRIGAALPVINGPTGFPCVWLNGHEPSRDAEGGEKSPNPPPPQLALPHETEGASTERTLHLSPRSPASEANFSTPGQTFLDHGSKPMSKLSPSPQPLVIQPTTDCGLKNFPRNPFEGRPGLEALFKAGQSTPHSDGEGSEGDSGAEVCPQCHKVFKRKVYLQRHMEREHWSTAKVFKCEDCSYETKHQSNLSVHRRTHTGERPYHCGACGQRYTQGHLLKSHIRSRHAGNMEFYNLDKKSDSTRGRKSLDIKHELGGTPKVDKISALLQAAANGVPRPNMPPPPPMPKFGNLLTPPIGGLPYFGGIRPMMTPMSLANSLLGGPRFFSLGGIANGLPPPSPLMPGAGLPLLGDPAALNPPVSNANLLSPSVKSGSSELSSPMFTPVKKEPTKPGIKLPLKVPDHEEGEEGLPQDLSTKRAADTPPSSFTNENSSSPLTSHIPTTQASTTLINSVPFPFSINGNMPMTPIEKFPEVDEEARKENTPLSQDRIPTDNNKPASNKSLLSPPSKRTCNSEKCTHLMKLQNLRRNVFRMLSTFTPDLSDENGISNDGDDVDELLHEVIYSNIDDNFLNSKD